MLTDSKRKKHSKSAKRAERKAWREKGLEKVLQEQEKEAFKEQQDEDKTLDALRQQAETKDSPFMMKDGLLWKRSIDRMGEDVLLLCITAEKRGLLLSLAHKSGHLGRDRTYRRLADEYHWPGMYADVCKMCRARGECQKVARWRKQPAPLCLLPVIDEPFSRIGMDMVGPLPRSRAGKKHILVIVDHATRWPEAMALHSTDSQSVADELLVLFTRTGVPRQILTDCGSNFTGKLMKKLYRSIGVTELQTTPYHPKGDGLVERFNATLKPMLKKMLKVWNGQWDLALPHVLGNTEEPHRNPLVSPFPNALWEADQGTPPESKGAVDSQRGSANRHCNVHNHCARSIRGVTKCISG